MLFKAGAIPAAWFLVLHCRQAQRCCLLMPEPSLYEAAVWRRGRGWVTCFPISQQSHLVVLWTGSSFSLTLKMPYPPESTKQLHNEEGYRGPDL